jgi:sugar phosphate isomerase/epimerase
VCQPGSLRVWEIPPTIVFYSAIGRQVPGVRALYRRFRRVRRLFDRRHLGSQWLRPYPHMTVERLKRVATLARRMGAPVLNLTFHSSELMPGGSPYNRTEESIENLFSRLEGFLSFVRAQRMEGVTLDEARDRLARMPVRENEAAEAV